MIYQGMYLLGAGILCAVLGFECAESMARWIHWRDRGRAIRERLL